MPSPKSDPFLSAIRSWERGKYHVRDLKANLRTFLDSQPWAHSVKLDSDGRKVHEIKWTGAPPEVLESIASDAAYNFRAALDHCSYTCAVLSGRTKTEHAYFPFGRAGKEGADISKTRSSDLPSEILAVFRRFKPYEGGNFTLWALNSICNTNKHAFIVGADNLGSWVAHNEAEAPHWDSEEQKIVFSHYGVETHSRSEAYVANHIVFDGIDKITGKPIVPLFEAITAHVGKIIDTAQRECARLGWITLINPPSR